MATYFETPKFEWDSDDLTAHFRIFRQYSERVLRTPDFKDLQDAEKVDYVVLWMGQKGVETFDTLAFAVEDDKKNPGKVYDAFGNYFQPKSNFRTQRLVFGRSEQKLDQKVDPWLKELMIQVEKCNFPDRATKDDRILDQIIFGTKHNEVRRKIINQDPATLTLDAALNIVRTFEATQEELKNFEQKVEVIKQEQGQECRNCGFELHRREDCPARTMKCHACGRIGHVAKKCFSTRDTKDYRKGDKKPWKRDQDRQDKDRKMRARTGKGIREVDFGRDQEEEDSSSDSVFDLVSIDGFTTKSSVTSIKMSVGGKEKNLKGKIDTGADGNILPVRTKDKMEQSGLKLERKHSNMQLTAYGGTSIRQEGTVEIKVQGKDRNWYKEKFFVVDTTGPVILGVETSQRLGLVQICAEISGKQENGLVEQNSRGKDTKDLKKTVGNLEQLKEDYPKCFTGLGKFPGQYKLTVDQEAIPVVHPPRTPSVHLKPKIKEALDKMEGMGVIQKQPAPTDWVSSITYQTKSDGSLRVCLDPKDLNKALKRSHHRTPTIDEIKHKFMGGTVFSKLDLKSGYWCIELTPESQSLTTFNSPFGRYCFVRLPFGINVSQDIFQREMDRILDGLPGVISITDDIAICGKDKAEHDKNLRNVMERARENGVVFNYDKCQIGVAEIKFFGHYFGKDGCRADPGKVKNIVEMNDMGSKEEVHKLLGMVTYLSSYIPRLSEMTAPLRALLSQDTQFEWLQSHQDTLNKIKKLVQDATNMVYFDKNKTSIVQVDASQRAIGAALLQDGKVVEFASKALKDAETRYANIERELLACVFGAERFAKYLLGGPKFIIQSDHKPLEMITKKNLAAAPARLQSMLIRLNKYDYEVEYKPGKEMILADTLSRLRRKNEETDEEIKLDVTIGFVQFSEEKKKKIKEEIQQDRELLTLKRTILNGFPEKMKDSPEEIRQYWPFRDELTIEDGLVVKGEQLVIPQTLRAGYLEKVHKGHLGITSCQNRAKRSIYWPGIYKQVEDLVNNCERCQEHQASQTKEPLEPVMPDTPNIPWYTIGTDLIEYGGKSYLVIADYYSKYMFVEPIANKTSRMVTRVTEKILTMFGNPEKIISDNGGEFIGEEYQHMLDTRGIVQVTSSPHWPRSHGFIERMNRTAKNLLKKNENLQDALLEYMTTPKASTGQAPADVIFGRRVRGSLPVKVTNTGSEDNRVRRIQESEKSKERYDKTAKRLEELEIGDRIYYQDPARRIWNPGEIIGYGPEPRSYSIEDRQTGRKLRRNRIMIRRKKTITLREEDESEKDIWEGIRLDESDNYVARVRPIPETPRREPEQSARSPSRAPPLPTTPRQQLARCPSRAAPEVTAEPRPKRQIQKPVTLKDFVTDFGRKTKK